MSDETYPDNLHSNLATAEDDLRGNAATLEGPLAKKRPELLDPIFNNDLCGPALRNAAVARCCAAWTDAFYKGVERDGDEVLARIDGHDAYRKTLPPLIGTRNIRDFVACVAHGLLIGAIYNLDGPRLLYAAQVATSARVKTKRRKKVSIERELTCNSRTSKPASQRNNPIDNNDLIQPASTKE